MYWNYCCVCGRWITNNHHFQVIFEVAFNSAKGGYVALDDISFSPIYCSNQTGMSSHCYLPSLSPFALPLWTVCQYLQHLVMMCRCCLLSCPALLGDKTAKKKEMPFIWSRKQSLTLPIQRLCLSGLQLECWIECSICITPAFEQVTASKALVERKGSSPDVIVRGRKWLGLLIIAYIGNILFSITGSEVFFRA